MGVAVAYASALGTQPWKSAERDRMKLSEIAATDVQPVLSDSLCAKAAATIYQSRPDTGTHVIYMVTFGTLYWATDPKLMGGEFQHVFMLDSTLTKIVAETSI